MKQKQPKSLYLLFFTELWERFGFYSLQTIIILYMSQGLHFTDDHAYLLYGTFSTLLYITPVIGGYLADRFLGFQRSIIIGGFLLAFGYLLCSLHSEQIFFLGLGILIAGNGFLKPNISSIVGTLYEKNDPRRESGFTLFYMGINIGALLPTIFIGTLVEKYGWHSGFLIATAGMILGIVTFITGRKYISLNGGTPKISTQDISKNIQRIFPILLIVGIIACVLISYFLFKIPKIATIIFIISSIFIFLIVIYEILKEEGQSRTRLIACVILIIISMGFWAMYNQTFTSLMLYAQRNMAKTLFGLPINPENTQFFNPFYIFVLSPFLSSLWIKLDKKNRNPSIPTKFTLALLFMAAGFYFLAIGDELFSYNGTVNPIWLAGSYFIQTVGELLISPIGLAMITVLSPKRLTGMMMGVWFYTQAISFAISGGLATISDVPKLAPLRVSLEIYDHAFIIYGSIVLILFFISLMLIPFLKKLIQK